MLTKKYLNDLTYEVIGATIEVHKVLGRGLLESVYHRCLIEELNYRKINFLTEMKVPIVYRNKVLDIDLRCDLFIENSLVIVPYYFFHFFYRNIFTFCCKSINFF